MTRAQDKQHERIILDSLCAALPGEWKVVDADREGPDAVIENSGKKFGVELAAYVAQTPKNERHEADEQLRNLVAERWVARPELQFFTPHIHYRDDERGRPTVPRPADRVAFLDSLEEAVLHYGGQDSGRDTKIVLREGTETDVELQEADRLRVVLSTKWPALARHCTDIIIGPHPHVRMLVPWTSMNSSRGWVDVKEIKRTVAKHLGKVSEYRANTGGLPILLVVHSDGYPLSRHIGDFHINAALGAAREAASSTDESFDGCLWLDSPTAMGGGTLYGLDHGGKALVDAGEGEIA